MTGKKRERENASGDRPLGLRTKEGTPYEVPVDGSLGLLALGYVGLMAWRQARAERKKQQQSEG